MNFTGPRNGGRVGERWRPVAAAPREARRAAPAETKPASPAIEYEFLPGAQDILQEILPVSFKVRLFKCFLDAAVSEQIARRGAMKAATENADKMIKALTFKYNRARQGQSTKEIGEVNAARGVLK